MIAKDTRQATSNSMNRNKNSFLRFYLCARGSQNAPALTSGSLSQGTMQAEVSNKNVQDWPRLAFCKPGIRNLAVILKICFTLHTAAQLAAHKYSEFSESPMKKISFLTFLSLQQSPPSQIL